MPLHGVIFDLDGTVVDSRLDFGAIRCEMGLPEGQPILEALAEMPDGGRKEDSLAVLRKHELAGADRATLIPGIREFLDALADRNLVCGLLTRNSRESTSMTLDRLNLRFSAVLTREDSIPKPDPDGLLRICEAWGISADEAVFVGDFRFDLEAAKNAGMPSVLYCPGNLPPYADDADFIIRDYVEAVRLIAELQQSDA